RKMDQTRQAIKQTQNPQQKEVLEEKYQKLVTLKSGLKEYVFAEVDTRFGQDVAIDSVIEGELLLATADYYHNTDFAEVENQPRFNASEINRLLEVSNGRLNNIKEPKIPNYCQGIYFIQDSLTHVEELTPLAKYNLKKITERNQYLPSTDKKAIQLEIDNHDIENKQTLEVNTPSISMFKLAKAVSKFLQNPQHQKKRNLEKLIKQTKAKDFKGGNRNIPLR